MKTFEETSEEINKILEIGESKLTELKNCNSKIIKLENLKEDKRKEIEFLKLQKLLIKIVLFLAFYLAIFCIDIFNNHAYFQIYNDSYSKKKLLELIKIMTLTTPFMFFIKNKTLETKKLQILQELEKEIINLNREFNYYILSDREYILTNLKKILRELENYEKSLSLFNNNDISMISKEITEFKEKCLEMSKISLH